MSNCLSEDHLHHLEEPLQVPLWYVIHTRSRHENKVDAGLRDKGLETFLPKMTVPSRRRQRQCLLEVPLFPGYLFVNTDLNQDSYYRIIRVPGVVRLLGLGGRCLPVPAETVQSIQAMVSSGQVYYPWPYLEKGMRVRIVEGPLAGATGVILERRDKKRRLVVGVELFHRAVAVELNDAALEPW
jgi:transcription termination/antitermination protein NusG